MRAAAAALLALAVPALPQAADEAAPRPWRAQAASLRLVHTDSLQDVGAPARIWPMVAGEWSVQSGEINDGADGTLALAGPTLVARSKRSYAPPFMSPKSLALLPQVRVDGAFAFEIEVLQIGVETAHRDAVLAFGFESPERFFYVHLGKVPDANTSNVLDVDGANRARLGPISETEIDWGRGEWRRLRVECLGGARVRVYFEDMETPLFDRELPRVPGGLLGFGTFDDAALFRNVRVWAERVSTPTWSHNPFADDVLVPVRVEPGNGVFPVVLKDGRPVPLAVGHASLATQARVLVVADVDGDGQVGSDGDRWYLGTLPDNRDITALLRGLEEPFALGRGCRAEYRNLDVKATTRGRGLAHIRVLAGR